MNNISDESVMDLDKRKYYIQNYDFTMLGYLIDEEEFQVKPAISRVVQLFELDTSLLRKKPSRFPENPDEFKLDFLFVVDNNTLSDIIDFTANMNLVSTDNVDSFDVYINNNYYGSYVEIIQITTNDILRIEVTKNDDTKDATIVYNCKLV